MQAQPLLPHLHRSQPRCRSCTLQGGIWHQTDRRLSFPELSHQPGNWKVHCAWRLHSFGLTMQIRVVSSQKRRRQPRGRHVWHRFAQAVIPYKRIRRLGRRQVWYSWPGTPAGYSAVWPWSSGKSWISRTSSWISSASDTNLLEGPLPRYPACSGSEDTRHQRRSAQPWLHLKISLWIWWLFCGPRVKVWVLYRSRGRKRPPPQ